MRALVLERASDDPGLVDALGAERTAAVAALLAERARAWAVDAFGASAVSVVTGRTFTDALVTDPGGTAGDPVVLVAPELAVWHSELAAAVRGDLQAGCALALAPIFDGGLYLLALAEPSPELVAQLAGLDLPGPRGMTGLIGLAGSEGWEVGLLRAERGLRRERDVRALLADPLTDGELRGLLE